VLVSSKLQPQPFRHGLLQRGRLIERLPDGGITLVAAPAGFGKTTLLSEWRAAAAPSMPFAWLTVDQTDSDPSRSCSESCPQRPARRSTVSPPDAATGSVTSFRS
jgi:LuxR family maltose regulon positive regulatory protein